MLCGYDGIEALSIDHIKGNGAEHRKAIKNYPIYDYLKKHNFPEGYRTLCMNCQFIERERLRKLKLKAQFNP